MAMPKEREIKKINNKLKKEKGSLALKPNASVLEKFRFELCQKFIVFKQDHGLLQKEMARKLEVDEGKISKILHHRISEFSTDRLILLYSKLDPQLKLEVS